jgi:hypothetical protein
VSERLRLRGGGPPIPVGEDAMDVPGVMSGVVGVVTGDILGPLDASCRMLKYHPRFQSRLDGLHPRMEEVVGHDRS